MYFIKLRRPIRNPQKGLYPVASEHLATIKEDFPEDKNFWMIYLYETYVLSGKCPEGSVFMVLKHKKGRLRNIFYKKVTIRNVIKSQDVLMHPDFFGGSNYNNAPQSPFLH